MTGREPLFKWSKSEVMFDVFGFKTEDGRTLVHLLNKAVEDRVKEAEKKAVEEFREKCLDIVLGDQYGMVTDEREMAHNSSLDGIADKIRELPT